MIQPVPSLSDKKNLHQQVFEQVRSPEKKDENWQHHAVIARLRQQVVNGNEGTDAEFLARLEPVLLSTLMPDQRERFAAILARDRAILEAGGTVLMVDSETGLDPETIKKLFADHEGGYKRDEVIIIDSLSAPFLARRSMEHVIRDMGKIETPVLHLTKDKPWIEMNNNTFSRKRKRSRPGRKFG